LSILDRITALLNGREQQELTNYLNLKKTAYSDWKSGKSESYRKYIVEIAEFFDVSIDYLVYGKEKNTSLNLPEDEAELLKYYKQLPEKEKIRLVSRAEAIADMYAEAAPEPVHPKISIKHSIYSVSAGTGDMLDTDEWDTIDVPDSPEARKADFCLTIHGNSMEPVYYNGDIVLVKEQQSVEKGQIGIFIIEGCGYIKKFGGDRLISLNEEYDDILLSDYDPEDIRCSGLVIGRV
jgi:bacteriophage CI repressor helix-turn-helix domain